ncbi:MAG: hypothetical protein NW206_02925 [Hyphomonadaceae bacterium]|nr:hypothetical protein [Hyphomonadaceae bacterium]
MLHSLDAEVRLVAEYYGAPVRAVRSGQGHAAARLARDALCWRLVTRYRRTAERVAALMQTDPEAVSASVAAHQKRIDDFRAQNFLVEAGDAA